MQLSIPLNSKPGSTALPPTAPLSTVTGSCDSAQSQNANKEYIDINELAKSRKTTKKSGQKQVVDLCSDDEENSNVTSTTPSKESSCIKTEKFNTQQPKSSQGDNVTKENSRSSGASRDKVIESLISDSDEDDLIGVTPSHKKADGSPRKKSSANKQNPGASSSADNASKSADDCSSSSKADKSSTAVSEVEDNGGAVDEPANKRHSDVDDEILSQDTVPTLPTTLDGMYM